MIKFNSNNINDWYYNTSDIIKVYRNNAICYYKLNTSGDTPTYDVCYAVVADITKYSDREFEDVFNKADDKWYKLNNLNQYEQYGVYGSGRNITYYDGKLTIDDGYEYQYSGNTWVNVGEVSGSTATLPNVPFSVNYNANNYDSSKKTLAKTSGQLVDTNAVITAGTPTVHDGYLTIASGTRATIEGYSTYFNRDNSNPNLTIVSKQRTDGNNGHMFANRDSNYNWMYRCYSNKLTLHGSSEQGSVAVTTQPVIESVRVNSSRLATYNNYTNGTSSTYSNFNYGSTNSGKFALFQGYGTTTGENFVGDFYWVYMSQNTLTDEQVQQVIAYNEGGGGQSEYPLYYDEIADPLDNLTFSSMTEATEYAYNNCVYDGMKATIAGDKYKFDIEEGWVVIPEYYIVEDVTSSSYGGSGWTVTGSSTYNPNPSYYDDFSTAPNSTSYQYKVAKVTIFGYESFTYYLRSSGYSNYAYVVATNIDELQSAPSSLSYIDSRAITNTYGWNKTPGSVVNLSNYRRITYNNLDKTVEHTFYVIFYNGYYYSAYPPAATLLIPKDQTNENWEQVTFSSSTNVSGSTKTLYIDGSTSTNYWYSRWMVGLSAGSHNSYVSYSNYDYCPNITSSTFTSVAGEQRQVNYSWNSTTTKSLQFRLVDTSGNTLTPSDTVYYNLYSYNSCGISSYAANTSLPRSINEKVGGYFYFTNSSNRHYIYGYSPSISLYTNYYTNDYTTNFDITYTKLDTEAVTVTYTTYDPNDTETPTFSTDISWPYGNSGTSSTTLASYEVPYTYSYTAKQTNDKFSASTYTYTAGQATRTISFTLYPNNREFTTVADMEAYQYAWEGMAAFVNGTKYEYKNGAWIEKQFTQYEYIKTVGTNETRYKFNTGFYPTTAHTIEVKLQMTDSSVDWGVIFGWSTCDGDRCDSTQYRFTTVTSSWALIARKGNTSGTNYYVVGQNKDVTCTIPISASTWTYTTGGSATSCNVNVGTFNSPSTTPLHILTLGNSGNKKSMHGKIYYLKVYDGSGNLVKHYVPSDNNGTPCFYEIIDGDYILNTYTGTYAGTLTLGPQV